MCELALKVGEDTGGIYYSIIFCNDGQYKVMILLVGVVRIRHLFCTSLGFIELVQELLI